MSFAMTDLEEQLQGPDGQAKQETTIARLEELKKQVISSSQDGLNPEQFELARTVVQALNAAEDIIRHYPVPPPPPEEASSS